MKALVTGSEGFVGKYLRAELTANGYDVTGLDLVPGEKTVAVNLLEPEAVETEEPVETEDPGEINIIEPTESLENAIDRLKKAETK